MRKGIDFGKAISNQFLFRQMATQTNAEASLQRVHQTLCSLERENRLSRINAIATLKPLHEQLGPHVTSLKRQPSPATSITTAYRLEDVQKAIQKAIQYSTLLRVVGSQHSVQSSIFTGTASGENLKLAGELATVQLIKESKDAKGDFALVRVGAGCHLGVDPSDPTSNPENSLNVQITKAGYALPIVGGMTHQTVAGFLQTGSAGGSVCHGFSDAIESIEFINGTGEKIVCRSETDLFNAVGVSMGLFGIVTHVTLKLRRSYLIEGYEHVLPEAESVLAKGVDGKYPLETVLSGSDYEYFHLNWFPQKHVRRVMQWKGKIKTEISPEDRIKPYGNPLSSWYAEKFAYALFKYIDWVRSKKMFDETNLKIIAKLFKLFIPLENKDFLDIWYKALATEDAVNVDNTINTLFTEIWLPIDKTTDVIDILNEMYKSPEIALGNYAVEIYGAKKSPFWLSPAHDRNVMRVDPYWWAHNTGNAADFFYHFWQRLLDLPGARLHWGKYIPKTGQRCGHIEFNLDYLKKVYPKMEEWLKLRETMDPHGIFVSEYWGKLFEIDTPIISPRP